VQAPRLSRELLTTLEPAVRLSSSVRAGGECRSPGKRKVST
jgi:hypothetical protein